MKEAVVRFYDSIENAEGLKQSERIDLFVYFLTVEFGEPAAKPKQVKECFETCDLEVPSRIAQHLSEGLKKKPAKFVKNNGGYRLQRHMRESLAKMLGAEKRVVQTSVELRKLETKLSQGPKREFLAELIDCFEASANRATIVMCWVLVVDHLYDHVFKHKLKKFNALLAKQNDRKLRGLQINNKEQFSDIREAKFIEICRSAKIVTNDVRKILDEKLGTRNSAAHPSNVMIKKSKVIDFVEDLIENVVLKYPA